MDPSTSSQARTIQTAVSSSSACPLQALKSTWDGKPQVEPTIHIASLSRLLQQLKTIGRTDLHRPLNGTATSLAFHLRATHQSLGQFIQLFTSPPVQDALKQARDLETNDPTIVPLTREEEDRVYPKRRKLARKSSSVVTADTQDATWDGAMLLKVLPPPETVAHSDITSATLMEYSKTLRNVTAGNIDAKIWRSQSIAEDEKLDPLNDDPFILRVELRDTFFIYFTLVAEGHGGLRTRKAVVFGLNEKRSPHLHSDFLIFKKLSQIFSSIISQRPNVPLPLLIELVSLYQNLYSTNCSVCGKVMSREDRLPPLQRLWQPIAPSQTNVAPKDDNVGDVKESQKSSGRWIPRHVGCRA
ncbi:hypothetical protein FRB97_008572 [Tulasnella sp. 331]|nr:hypothetical protein FRB97_008572 [Tulasnella sp. 331]